MKQTEHRNLTMLMDFYELTMSNGYFETDYTQKTAYFDMFFRKIPDDGGYAVMAGLEQTIDYLSNLNFTEDDVEYLRNKGIFCEGFLEYLKNFKFSCDVWAVPEGTPIFPYEPIVTVRGPVIQAQLVETMVLLTINHQSLIATKASRIVRASQGRPVMEFGSRRAQGTDAAIMGARAAFIGGCAGTACAIADFDYNVPALGTMAHSFVQMFPTELDAFKAYSKIYPKNAVLLVDTYSVLESGVPNAIKAFKEIVIPMGYKPGGIRIDSGDITYLTNKARQMLDEAGLKDCPICVSNALDEYTIRDIISQGAKIDSFGVGERLITSRSEPVFGGVYKLSAIEDGGVITPKIKISENVEKITNPGFKSVWRLFDKTNGKAFTDIIALADETIDESKPYYTFDPEHTWKHKTVSNFTAKRLLVPIFEKGKLVYDIPPLSKVRSYCKEQVSTLWDEVVRFENPHSYHVDLSKALWELKQEMLK